MSATSTSDTQSEWVRPSCADSIGLEAISVDSSGPVPGHEKLENGPRSGAIRTPGCCLVPLTKLDVSPKFPSWSTAWRKSLRRNSPFPCSDLCPSQADPAFSSTAIETGKCSCRSQTKALPQQTREEFDSDDSRPGWRNLQVFYVAVDLFDLMAGRPRRGRQSVPTASVGRWSPISRPCRRALRTSISRSVSFTSERLSRYSRSVLSARSVALRLR
jgi:hypothetical protein